MNTAQSHFGAWFRTNWSRVSLPAALILLALSPFLWRGLSLAAFLIFLQLPIYMLHQFEEHGHGKFQAFINHYLGHDHNILTDTKVFWINVVGVWVVDLCALYVAVYVNPALGLFAIYLSLVNGLTHIGASLAMRRYNPGLWTSIALFLPVGGYALYRVSVESHATVGAQVLGLIISLIIHALTIIVIRWGSTQAKPVVAEALATK